MDDPWSWDVDRVVQELCSANPSWQPSPGVLKFPPPEQLESSLREQEVNGFTLLTCSQPELCSELGFKTLRHKASLQHVIDLLRFRSQKYKLNEKKRESSQLEVEDDEGGKKSVSPTKVASLAPASVLEKDNTASKAPVPDRHAARRRRVVPIPISPNVNPKVGHNIPTEADVILGSRPSPENSAENGREASLDKVYLGEDALTRIDLIDDSTSKRRYLANFVDLDPAPPGRQVQVQKLFRHRVLYEASSKPHRTKSDLVPGANDPEHDEVLPLYGDSDEEYDSETWEEIEAERLERLEAEARPGLNGDEVQAIIDDSIHQFASDWRARKLFKLSSKANKLWEDARKLGLKRSIDKNRGDINACEARLTKYCKELSMQYWRKATELKESALILQQTVEDKEYFSSVLGIITAPVAPPTGPSLPRPNVRRARARAVKAVTDDEEILTSESEEDFDDFIVDDEASNSGPARDGSPMDLVDDDDDVSSVQQQNDESMDLEYNDTIDLTHLDEDTSVSHPKTPSKSRERHIVDLVNPKKSALISNGSLGSKHGGTSTGKRSKPVIQGIQPTLIMAINDLEPAEQIVARELAKLDRKYLSDVFNLATSIQPDVNWLDVMRDELAKQHDTSKGNLFAVYTLLRLFEVYKGQDDLPRSVGWYKKQTYKKIAEIMQDWEKHEYKVGTYIDFLCRLSDRFDWDEPPPEVEDTTPANTTRPKSAPAKRKPQKKFVRQQEAESIRETERARVAGQAYRRDVLRKKLEQLEANGTVNLNDKDMIINESKADHQGLIYVHPEIAPRIKEHQVGGVRFMWDQIVSSSTKQGCLLAHTMGLGKTMQIVTLLVAIADAAGSNDPEISSQIPPHLKESKTLILCPPSVIDNWMDELLFWAPEGHKIGEFFKIVHATGDLKRKETVLAWNDRGGVIIFGYSLFTDFMGNEELCDILSNSPNLVVADEAHMLKNPRSQVHNATANFRTHSRIALTGSPLANKVEEYHTMINWVAPNYLSDLRDFRANYANPIKEGLNADSSNYQRRRALKMLRVLKEEVAPKVQRVTTAVLKHDLLAKKEFVLFVPLTEIQRIAYETFIHFHRNRPGTSSFSTVDTLSVLCAHPAIFLKKLEKKQSEPTSDSKKMETLPSELVSEEIAVLRKIKDVTEHSLSWKVLILLLILDECKRIGDTVLIFSQSILTIDYLEILLRQRKISTQRLDGSTPTEQRQGKVKEFQKGKVDAFLISTRAGGVGLNMTAANRVIVFDAKFNPQHEQQAVGRAYRIGQMKPVYVYRLVCGGTSEAKTLNMAIWKMQLASRVVDKKNPIPKVESFGTSLEMPTEPEQEDIGVHAGKDGVLDLVISKYGSGIRAITMMDTFEEEELEDAVLTPEDRADADRLVAESEARRLRKPVPDLNQIAVQNWQAFKGELTRSFLMGARSHDQDQIRRIAHDIAGGMWDRQSSLQTQDWTKWAIMKAASSPRFVEALRLGLLSPTNLIGMTESDIETRRAELDKLTAEEWEKEKGTIGSQPEADPEVGSPNPSRQNQQQTSTNLNF
ncbi:hypothetical protein F5Y13DRAFT_151166 [Hypoxylon sp. FL1857]|nr:hypothetical protein F5Y13DRAFT_151166 [Hypoxylon sp. FL1857]